MLNLVLFLYTKQVLKLEYIVEPGYFELGLIKSLPWIAERKNICSIPSMFQLFYYG